MIIDAHHHFWKYDPQEYDWIDDTMQVIRRSFMPHDLHAEIKACGIDGVVTVQARETLKETDWLLELAEQNGFIKGVVGWLPLAADDLSAHLDRYTDRPKLKALRHVVQGQPEGFLDAPDFNRGIGKLKTAGLVYDILIFENQLAEAIRFVDRHPQQSFVLDHIAKPRINEGAMDPWQQNIRELAKRGNVSCKLSGLVTEADWSNWTEEQLHPYLSTVLDAFGPSRLMLGTDWPVCTLGVSYAEWVSLLRRFISDLSSSEQADILGETACRIYSLTENFKESQEKQS